MSYTLRLDVFEGPLPLLLHLIRSQKLDIYDIPIASVTEQYLEYLRLMEELNLDVAGEFLVMAATLMEIKSRLLLPKPPREVLEEEGPDPREELVQKLLEYERFQSVAENLRQMEQEMRRQFARATPEDPLAPPLAELTAGDLLGALQRMLAEAARENGPQEPLIRVRRDKVNLKARIAEVWARVREARAPVSFSELLPPAERTRSQIVVTFMAILELLRDGRIAAWQEASLGDILLTPREPETESG